MGKKCYSVFLALLPILSLYRMPVIAINAGLFGLLLFAVFHLLLCFSSNAQKTEGKTWPVLFYLYILIGAMFIRLTNPSVLSTSVYYRLFIFFIITIPAFWAASVGLVDFSWARKTIELVSLVASFCIFFQYISHYVFGSTPGTGRVWLLPFRSQLAGQFYMSQSMVSDGLFRPAAFFLEPAHYAQYCIIALASCLIPRDNRPVRMDKAIILSLGLLLSTSGIGIALTAFVWIYFAQSKRRFKNRVLTVSISAVVLLAVFASLYQFEFFRAAVARFMSDGASGENAYAGRLYTFHYYKELSTLEKWVGVGFQNLPVYTKGTYEGGAYYMVGIVELLYCLGSLGAALCLLTLLASVIHTRGFAQCVAIMYLGMVFMAARLKTVDVVFYLTIVYGSYQAKGTIWRADAYPAGRALTREGRAGP